MTTTTQGVTSAASLAGHAQEVARGERFEFGQNWTRFLATVNDARVLRAEASLKAMLGRDTLAGLTFLDIGCGSGLFSLAARRLGATVHSFDYDPQSVACSRKLKERYLPDDAGWHIEWGSVLDAAYLDRLGRFDVVYSWGVLHHTGAMWQALEHAHRAVAANGTLFIAIYNDMGSQSIRWRHIKRLYVQLPTAVKPLYACAVSAPEEAKAFLRALLAGRPQDYVASWTKYERNRGMSRWRDIIDWVGGYPYEFAKPDAICSFFIDRGFALDKLCIGGGLGCSEYVFSRSNRSGR
jgi:2-polyprenyl-3-methyl-5-hydroxy-6-metoxy-1,4-benzoquinol methylase